MLQRNAVQKFHSNECLPILLADVMNRADVRVIERRRGLRFALKTGECLRVTGDIFWQELESDETVQPRVLCLVHYTHATTAELLDDAVVRDGPIEGDVKRHFFRLHQDAADALAISS